jgi:hypothetical protein
MRNFSCAFARLYAAGGFYEAPEVAQAFADLGDECRWIANLYPAFAYRRPEPVRLIGDDPTFLAELREQYARWDETYERGASADLFELANGLLFNRCLYKSHGNEIVQLYETNKPADRPWRPDLDPAVDLRAIKVPRDDAAGFFYLGSIGSENYAHWLVDDLTRARSLLVHFAPEHLPTIVLNAYHPVIDAIRAQSLHALFAGIADIRISFVNYRDAHFFARLHFVSPATYHPFLKSPDGIAFLHDALVERGAPLAGARRGRRLFVTRRALWRNVLNLDDAIAYFRARSFTIVELDGLSFADQVATFAHAELIVGVMGAGMANTVFSPPGARVVHLAPSGWHDPFFWDLAAVKAQPFAVVFGRPWQPQAPAFSSFTIEPEQLDGAAALF